MKKLIFSLALLATTSVAFANTIEDKEETPSIEILKPLDCTVTSGAFPPGEEISVTAATCEEAMELLALIEEVYWED